MTAEQNLLAWAREVVNLPFKWGETDCALLTLQALEELTGRDLAWMYRRSWATEREALAHFEQERPSEVLAGLGLVEIPAITAAIGDILTVPAAPWPEQLHVVLGRFCVCTSPERGVHLLPAWIFSRQQGARAWRVPCPRPSR